SIWVSMAFLVFFVVAVLAIGTFLSGALAGHRRPATVGSRAFSTLESSVTGRNGLGCCAVVHSKMSRPPLRGRISPENRGIPDSVRGLCTASEVVVQSVCAPTAQHTE